VPWHSRVLVGTTDTAVERPALEPVALEEEIEFILEHAAKYLTKDPERRDVLSVFAGLRPLVRSVDKKSTAALSRDHIVNVSQSGLVSIAGGKWTIYRKMAEDAVDHAAAVAGLERRQSVTSDLPIHGWVKVSDESDPLQFYGSDAVHIRSIANSDEELRQPLHPSLPYTKAEVVWAARHEMACSVEDILARRTRALLLDARASIEAAADVAELLAAELKKDSKWTEQQVKEYRQVARNYVLA
jgi:glycerol-3-phosphate dehydrogenase